MVALVLVLGATIATIVYEYRYYKASTLSSKFYLIAESGEDGSSCASVAGGRVTTAFPAPADMGVVYLIDFRVRSEDGDQCTWVAQS